MTRTFGGNVYMKNRQSLDWDLIFDGWAWMLSGASALSAIASLMVLCFLVFVLFSHKQFLPSAPLNLLLILLITTVIAFGLHSLSKYLKSKKPQLLARIKRNSFYE